MIKLERRLEKIAVSPKYSLYIWREFPELIELADIYMKQRTKFFNI